MGPACARYLFCMAVTTPRSPISAGRTSCQFCLAELIEAATRSGMTETAAGAYRRLAEITGANPRCASPP